jgi:L-lactate dehydrogenase complex protein LldE
MATRVALFVTCLVDALFPRVGLAVAEVLEREGCKVEFPASQTCCGQPAFNSGYIEEPRQVARHFLKVFASGNPADYIVVPSGSCTSMITHHFEDLFQKEPDLLRQLHEIAPRVCEFSTFLTDVLKVEDVGARFPHTVTFHDSCHALRDLGVKAGPRRLLQNVKGLTLQEMSIPEECCGFGGTFSAKFAALSGGMAATKIQSIEETGAEYVTGVDVSCLMHLEGALRKQNSPVRAIHLAEILASR